MVGQKAHSAEGAFLFSHVSILFLMDGGPEDRLRHHHSLRRHVSILFLMDGGPEGYAVQGPEVLILVSILFLMDGGPEVDMAEFSKIKNALVSILFLMDGGPEVRTCFF